MEIRILEKLDLILKLLKGEKIEDGYMDITGVSKYSSCSKSHIRNACREGKLKYNDSQGKHLFLRSNVESWLNNG
ncbi:MAG: helix-turn-helix domain-containing protein [Candidatus Marinimicrobia bacterium]|nr:helix-turn-helix domain-containing protein [Candidatus Neomarinimicrobiota bacterium]